jgi:hypothetical protein
MKSSALRAARLLPTPFLVLGAASDGGASNELDTTASSGTFARAAIDRASAWTTAAGALSPDSASYTWTWVIAPRSRSSNSSPYPASRPT